jgi:prolyl-tRNA synthetase
VMGSYGIGPARTLAAVVEQHHDENGIVWPRSIAPYDVHVLSLDAGSEEILGRAQELAASLEEAGLDVLLDDRDERPGEKFADADLIGIPARVIVGRKTLEDGRVDARSRDGTVDERMAVSDVLKWVTDR